MPPDRSGGMVESFLGMFSPLSAISKDLQQILRLDRTPACRGKNGRLEILLRGGGMTSQPIESRIALAQQLTDAVRPLLSAHSKREIRRYATHAISIAFEDEQVVQDAIATMRFTYLASHDAEPMDSHRDRGGRRHRRNHRSRDDE